MSLCVSVCETNPHRHTYASLPLTLCAAILRELTVKSVPHFISKLLPATIDSQVLPYLARLQTDPEPAIRTNTTYCLAKIATHLSAPVREKVCVCWCCCCCVLCCED